MSVKVAVRSRPMNESEAKASAEIIVRMNENEVAVVESVEGYGSKFLYDSALWSTGQVVAGSANAEASQEYVYKAIGAELLDHIMTGYNGCIFAYGQTGSGKTYCMMGNEANPGIIPRIAENLFEQAAALRSQNMEVCVEVSYYEIYNERVRCLLRPTQGGYDDLQLRVREHPKYGPFIEGLAKFVVSTQTEFLKLMSDGNKVRTTASTAMNATSSRSHAVFAITLTQKHKKGVLVTQKTSRLNLVDLAGSERASKTLATGKRLQEGSNINKSLTCLGNVISALAEVEETGKSRHIPYRDSTLTWILKDNLGGNSKTVMLATISPSSLQYEETMSTLRYAERAKKIVNKAVVNETNNNELIAALQKEISALRDQLASASTAERERLQEELDASEAVKKELTSSLAEKLAQTKRMMEEREQYMRELEARLNAQTEEIEKLRVANEEKERRIDELLRRIQSLDASGSVPDKSRVEKIREQVAALEQEQNETETHMRECQLQQQCRRSVDVSEDDEGGPSLFAAAKDSHAGAAALPPLISVAEEPGAGMPLAVLSALMRSRNASFTVLDLEDGDDGGPAPADEAEEADTDLVLESHQESADEDLVLEEEWEASAPADSDLDELLVVDSDLEVPPDSAEPEKMSEVALEDAVHTPLGDSPPAQHTEKGDVPPFSTESPARRSSEDAGAAGQPGSLSSPTDGAATPPDDSVRGGVITQRELAEQQLPKPSTQGATINEMQVALEDFFTKSRDRPEIYAPNDHTAHLVIPSHALPNNRYLHEHFRVTKSRESSAPGHTKARVWEIDMFKSRFTCVDASGVRSLELPVVNLFRVEKNAAHSRRLTLYFFDGPHPYELEFATTARRQQFFELAMVLRRNSILWCPSLCLEGENDVTITVRGSTIDRPGRKGIPVSGDVKMTVARMPYEVIDLWYGCFSLGDEPLPRSTAVFSGFFPKEQREIYVIGVMDVPASLLGTDELGRYFLAYLGPSTYFVLANTAVSATAQRTSNAVVVLCKRSFIVRVANIELLDSVRVQREGIDGGDFTAVGCCLRINESSVCVILVNTKAGVYAASTRAACIRTLLSSFPFGDPAVDISMRFDYFIVSGAFHFGGDFSADDALIREILTDNLMSNMREMEPSATLRTSAAPLRIFYSVRPNVSRMDVSAYSTSRALGLANAFLSADVFCQRSFLSLFGEPVPHVQIMLDKVAINGPRLPLMGAAELRVSMDAVEGSPVPFSLVHRGDDYVTAAPADLFLQPCVSNPEFLRLQTLTFTVLGSVGSAETRRRMVVASGVFPLKSATLGEPALLHIPLYYRGCTVGKLSAVLLQLYCERNTAEISALGLRDVRCATLASCYENEIRGGDGQWTTASSEVDGVFPFSTEKPTVARALDSFQLPDVQTWRWLTEWQHDHREDDPDGWAYADTVDGELQLVATPASRLRRRRWTRVMQAMNPLAYHAYLAQQAAGAV